MKAHVSFINLKPKSDKPLAATAVERHQQMMHGNPEVCFDEFPVF
jgi:hypothetical protein